MEMKAAGAVEAPKKVKAPAPAAAKKEEAKAPAALA
jgi:hypothetical protein